MDLSQFYYVQHIDGDFFCGYREVYTPTKTWAATWSSSPQVGRTLDDAREAIRELQHHHGIGETRIVHLVPLA